MFPHQIAIQWSKDEGAFVASIEALGVTANGGTPEAALRAVLIAAGAETEAPHKSAAAAFGRAGGLKGGAARAASLSKKKRAEIARAAAKARWSKL